MLRAPLAKHPDLRQEAESIAIEMVSSPSVENVAENVLDAVTSLDIDSFHGRAGKQPWGYVEPTETAWELPPGSSNCALAARPPTPARRPRRRPALAAQGARR